MAELILIVGLPGAGKSTLARELEVERSAVRLTPDEWMAPLFGAGEFEGKRWVLESELLWSVAARVLTLGGNVILDYGCWGPDERDLFRSRAKDLGAETELIVLDPPLEVLWSRLEARNANRPADVFELSRLELEEFDGLFDRPTAEEYATWDRSTFRSDAD